MESHEKANINRYRKRNVNVSNTKVSNYKIKVLLVQISSTVVTCK